MAVVNVHSSDTFSTDPSLWYWCLACEFPNESGKVQVGYGVWLDDLDDKAALQEKIDSKSIVIIRWPTDCDIMPPRSMMKKKITEFIRVPTIIHAQGDWKEMCEIVKKLEKHGVGDLGEKHDRHKFAAKITQSDSSDECSQQLGARTKKTERQRDKRNLRKEKEYYIKKNNEELLKKQQKSRNSQKDSKDGTDGADVSNEVNNPVEVDSNNSQNLKKKFNYSQESSEDDITVHGLPNDKMFRQNRKRLYVDASDEDEDDDVMSLTKQELMDKISVLQEEKKILKRENQGLKALKIMSEGLPDTLKMFKELQKNIQNFRKLLPSSSASPSSQILNDWDMSQPSSLEIFWEKYDDDSSIIINKDKFRAAEYKLRGRDFNKMISEGLSILFTKEELLSSSLSGGASNFHLKYGVLPKNPIDRDRINFLKDYVRAFYGKDLDFDTKFNLRVRQKLNNTHRLCNNNNNSSSASSMKLY